MYWYEIARNVIKIDFGHPGLQVCDKFTQKLEFWSKKVDLTEIVRNIL